MKPTISQSILSEISKDEEIKDCQFSEDRLINTSMFYGCFTMRDDRRECKAAAKLIIGVYPEILN